MVKGTCWSCGKSIPAYAHGRIYCSTCKQLKAEQDAENKKRYHHYKNLLMIERALQHIEKDDGNDLDFYKEAVEAVTEFCEANPTKFDSTEECIAAIVLIAHCVKIKCQYKILKYRVDFLLPELKVVLEIDGQYHKSKITKDSERDMWILHELGEGWEIVRIPTDEIQAHPKRIYDYVLDIRIVKQKYREEHKNELSLEMERIVKQKEKEEFNKELVKKIDNGYGRYGIGYLRRR